MRVFILICLCAQSFGNILEDVLARYPGQNDYISPTINLVAVAGNSAYLPCNLSSQHPEDYAILILWYKSDIVKPIYSYDVRSGLPAHYKSELHLGSRAAYAEAKRSLELKRVSAEDIGIYKCRVDFKNNPTLSQSINLTVIVPPRKLWILSDSGEEVSQVVGTYRIGDRVLLTCKTLGGFPPPVVRWMEGDVVIDDVIERKRLKVVSNTLMIGRLSRSDLNRSLTCSASNSLLVSPLQKSVTIDMIFSPLSVKIFTKATPLSANQRYKLECKVVGARPRSDIMWTLSGQKLVTHSIKVSEDLNVTVSTLLWAPRIEDSGQELSCRTKSLADSEIYEDSIIVVVYYRPIVSIKPGGSLDLSNIEDGDDVYFECHIKAVPPVYKIAWMLNGNELLHNVTIGIIISNQSLVLQKVKKSSSGDYSCKAANIEGEASSSIMSLRVKYAPSCHSSQTLYHGAAKHEQVHISCHLDSHPFPKRFIWTFNNSGESVNIPEDHVQNHGPESTVSYTPRTELDYGTLLCSGENAVGAQRKPCIFHVFPAGHPDPVQNCSQFNLSDSAINIRCHPGFDGGLEQKFVLELYDNHSSRLVANVTGLVPVLSVSELGSGSTYAAIIFAINEKGSGELYRLQVYTLKDNAEKRTAAIKPAPSSSENLSSDITPLLIVIAGSLTGVCLVATAIVIALKFHLQRKRANNENQNQTEGKKMDNELCSDFLATGILRSSTEVRQNREIYDDSSPDLILNHGLPEWCGTHVHTISSSSLVGSYATLPRRLSNQFHGCSSENFPDFGLSRTPSLQLTYEDDGQFKPSSCISSRRLSHPAAILPPPPPQFATPDKMSVKKGGSWVYEPQCEHIKRHQRSLYSLDKGVHIASQYCSNDASSSLFRGQHESSV